MANKTIGQLTEATSVQTEDLFVLEQTGTAKKLTGQTLINDLTAALDGHGGIASIELTGKVGIVSTYTITFADTTTATFIVTDGVTFTPTVSADGVISWTNNGEEENPQSVSIKGDRGTDGTSAYVWIRWASNEPTSDADIGTIPDDWMGVYSGDASTAPTAYTAYQWYEVKGSKGERGDPITDVERTSGDGSPGTDDTYTVYVNSTAVGTFIVHNGMDGLGTVNSVNGIGVSAGTNNVVLTAADVGAAGVPLHLEATATSFPLTISNTQITSTMRVIECTFGTPKAINGDVTWTTADGSIVLSGTMSGSTTVDLVLIETT